MPLYSVTLKDLQATDWDKTSLKVKAVSAKHAMKKAENKINSNYLTPHQYLALSARLYKTDHDYWHKIWKRAYNNMPTRIHVSKLERWVKQERNSTTMPDFIKQSVRGMMYRDDLGVVYKKVIARHAYKMGAQNALTRLLQYARFNGHGSMAHMAVLQAMARGSRPKTEERRELLIRLAGPDGSRIAAEMLGRPFRTLKIRKPK